MNSKSEKRLPSSVEVHMPICFECYKDGIQTELKYQKSTSTLMSVNEFYDEGGVLHHHDPNVHSVYYKCDKGHELILLEKPVCGVCGWPDD